MATRRKTHRPTGRKVKAGAAKRPSRPKTSTSRTAASGGRQAKQPRRQPETLRLRSVTPTYTVSDLDKSIAWYCDGLGFIVQERWKDGGGKLNGVMLRAGSCTFGLSQDDFTKGRDREKGLGFRIYVDTAQDVDALADRIRAYGGRITMEPTDVPWGARIFAVEDPDGFKISFSKER